MPGRLHKFIGQRQDVDQARNFLGPRPVKEEGETIQSYNQRLGKHERDFQTIVTGVSAKERAAAANTPGLSDEQRQYVWWNGANEQDTPGFSFLRPQTPVSTPGPTDHDPAGKYDLTPATINPLGYNVNATPKPAVTAGPAPIISGAVAAPRVTGAADVVNNPPMGMNQMTRPRPLAPQNPRPMGQTKPRPFTMGGLFQ